jgi:hypothetical protein
MVIKYKIHFLIFSLLLSFNSIAQSDDWELYRSIDGVQLFTMKVNCITTKGGFDRDLVLIKVINTTNTIKSVSWKEALWYNDKCVTCNSSSLEYLRELSLPPNAELAGECEAFDHPYLSLFVQFTDEDYRSENVQVLTKFEFQDLKVE